MTILHMKQRTQMFFYESKYSKKEMGILQCMQRHLDDILTFFSSCFECRRNRRASSHTEL